MLNDITWSDHLKIKNVHIKTSTFSPNKTVALLTAKDTVYHGKKWRHCPHQSRIFQKKQNGPYPTKTSYTRKKIEGHPNRIPYMG